MELLLTRRDELDEENNPPADDEKRWQQRFSRTFPEQDSGDDVGGNLRGRG